MALADIYGRFQEIPVYAGPGSLARCFLLMNLLT